MIGCFLVDDLIIVMMKIFMMIFRRWAPVIVFEGQIINYNNVGGVNLTSNLPAICAASKWRCWSSSSMSNTFIKLFVNHRPVYGIGKNNIEEAFKAIIAEDNNHEGGDAIYSQSLVNLLSDDSLNTEHMMVTEL